jgi:hypothetical protein
MQSIEINGKKFVIVENLGFQGGHHAKAVCVKDKIAIKMHGVWQWYNPEPIPDIERLSHLCHSYYQSHTFVEAQQDECVDLWYAGAARDGELRSIGLPNAKITGPDEPAQGEQK